MDVFHHAGRRTLPTVDGSTRQFEYRQDRFSGTEMELFTNHKYYDAYIGYAAFMYCDSLTSIFIPSSVDGMLNQVFSHSPNLETIYCEHTHKPAGWHDDWTKLMMALAIQIALNGTVKPQFMVEITGIMSAAFQQFG